MLVQLYCLANSKEFTADSMHRMALELQEDVEKSVPVSYLYFLLLNRYGILSDELVVACATKVVGNAYYALRAISASRFIMSNSHWRKLAIENISKVPKYARQLLQRQGLMLSDDEYDLLLSSVCEDSKQSYKLLSHAFGFLPLSMRIKLLDAVSKKADNFLRQLITKYHVELEATGLGVQLLNAVLASDINTIRHYLSFYGGELPSEYVDLIISNIFEKDNELLAHVLGKYYQRHLSEAQYDRLVAYAQEKIKDATEDSWE